MSESTKLFLIEADQDVAASRFVCGECEREFNYLDGDGNGTRPPFCPNCGKKAAEPRAK